MHLKPSRNSSPNMLPWLRLLSLSAILLMFGTLGLLFIRYMSSGQTFAPSSHPWMSGAPWQLVRLPPDHCDLEALKALTQMQPLPKIWIDVQRSSPQEWQLVCPAESAFATEAHLHHGPAMAQVLPIIKNKDVIFNVRTPNATAAKSFLAATELPEDSPHIGIASPSQGVVRELRKLRPQWVFASDFSTWAKFKLYASLGIETAVDLWPDFFVASADPQSPNAFFLTGANEIHRRQKKLIVETDSDSLAPQILRNSDGVLTNRPKNFSPDTFFGEMRAK